MRGTQGFRWTSTQATIQWLPPSLLDDPEAFLLNTPPKRLLKESPVRWVAIFSGPQGEFLLKRYKTRGVRERLKHCVVPSKAQQEWVVACRALAKGIPTPLPLAVAERRRGMILHDAFLITQAISPSVPLIELIPAGKQKTLLPRTARLIREAHEAGLFHKDLHAGNILVDRTKKQLYLIDLHRSIFFVRSLSQRRRLWNLAQFFYSLTGSLSPEDKEAFLQQYDAQKDTFTHGVTEGLRQIDRLEERIYRRHMKSRTKRCLKNSGGFYVVKEDNWHIWARREWKPEALLAIMKKHGEIVAKGKEGLIKDDRRTAITLFDFKKRRICVKEYRYTGILLRLKKLFRRSKARTGWLMGNGLVVRGITGITPQAFLERRRGGVCREAFLIMETPPGYVELDRYMVRSFTDSRHGRRKPRAFLKALAGFMADLYNLRISHRDLKTCNIMVHERRDTWDFGVVDMDDIQLNKKISHHKMLKTLVQLNSSTPLFIDMRDRIRFLSRYLNLIKRYNVRDMVRSVIKSSKGRKLVYVTPKGDVIMEVDWEKSCALAFQAPPTKKKL